MSLARNPIYRAVSHYEQIPLLAALLVICAYLTFATNGLFITPDNILNVLRSSSIELIAALGMTVALLAGQVDLSIGSLLAVVGVVTVTVYNATGSVLVAVVAGLVVGVFVGLVNGLLVTGARINALIATLGMMALLRGIGYLSTNARAVQTEGTTLTYIGTGYIGPIPVPIVIAVAVLIVVWYFLNQTTFGRYVYAVGGNERAALSAGLPVRKITIAVFVIVAVTAAVSGLITAARLNSFQPTIGLGFELNVIAAVILGGTRLTGGEGTVSGTLLGVLILGVLSNGLVLLDVNSFWQEVVRGAVIILAVVIDEYRKRSQESRLQTAEVEGNDRDVLQTPLKEHT